MAGQPAICGDDFGPAGLADPEVLDLTLVRAHTVIGITPPGWPEQACHPAATSPQSSPSVSELVSTANELSAHPLSVAVGTRGLIEPDYLTPGGHARWDVERIRAEVRQLRYGQEQ